MDKHTNILTVAIPVFERYEFFEAAVASVLNQSIIPKLIVVDNNSKHDLFEKFCKKNKITYYKNDTNIGMFRNWNRCHELADSIYVMVLGDDDTLEPNFVNNFLTVLNNHSTIDLYYTNFNVIKIPDLKKSNHNHIFPFGYFPNGKEVINYAIKYGLGLLYSVIIRKNKFTGYYFDFHGSNDWLWIYSNIENFEIYGEKDSLVNYGIHELQDSSFKSNSHLQCILTVGYIYERVLKITGGISNENIYNAQRKANAAMLKFFCIVSKEKLSTILSQSNIYSNYLYDFLTTHRFYKIYSYVPLFIRIFTYKVLRKLKLIHPF